MMKVAMSTDFRMTKKSRLRCVQERALDDLAALERDSSPHDAEEKGGEGDDPEAPDLEEDDGDHLARKREILPDVNHRKTCHANGGCSREEGINETKSLGRGEGKPEENGAGENQAGKAEDEDSLR